MNKTLFSVLCLLIGIRSFATDIVVYSYDNAGNRIVKDVVVSYDDTKSRNIEDSIFQRSILQLIEQPQIFVSPNPTQGKCCVKISTTANINPIISVYTISGSLIYRVEDEIIAEFDLSGYASGIYVVSIEINGEKRAIKVIKR